MISGNAYAQVMLTIVAVSAVILVADAVFFHWSGQYISYRIPNSCGDRPANACYVTAPKFEPLPVELKR